MSAFRTVNLLTMFWVLLLTGCTKQVIKPDLSTPEGAILKLEEAYRQQDIESAVACKDFKIEAAYMLRDKPQMNTPEVVAKISETLEMAYRAEMKNGFPDLKGVSSSFPKKRDIGDGKMVVTEKCRYPDGSTSMQDILVTKTEAGWKVMIPVK